MEAKSCQTYYVRNIEDGQTVALVGEGEFTIGLTLNERIACSPSAQQKPSPAASAAAGVSGTSAAAAAAGEAAAVIVVPLVVVTVWRTAGVTVAPASRDLRCLLNGQDIAMEANFIPGNQVEVGDKQLELLDEEPPVPPARPKALTSAGASFTSSTSEGSSASPSPSSRTPTPSGQTTRRQLPPTPGVPILPVPPRKPQRVHNKQIPPQSAGPSGKRGGSPGTTPQTVKDVGKDALREWCRVQLPNSEDELLQQTKNPDQLASLASSYLGRHVNLYTGVVMTTDLTDRIFRVMLEVAQHRRDILHDFLTEVIDAFNKDEEEDTTENSDALSRSSAKGADVAHHATVMAVLVEILKQFLDPQFLVLLSLQLLRALSQIPGSVHTMVESHTATAVLGSMAAYREDGTIQSFCLDILAKVATYVPAVLEKPPLKESSIDLVMMALTLHYKKLPVAQGGTRTLANLACSLHSLSFAAMKGKAYPELVDFVTQVISVMVYLYETTSAMVRQCLGHFSDDLTVKMDGRRFLFESTKMDQLKQQQKLWEVQPQENNKHCQGSNPLLEDGRENSDRNCEADSGGDGYGAADETASNDTRTGLHVGSPGESDEASLGILKKARSFENLRSPERRISFANKADLPTDSSETSSSSSSRITSPIHDAGKAGPGGTDSPDIQVLSRSIITPTLVSLGDSTDGEVGPPHDDADCRSPDQSDSLLTHTALGPAPPKPARRSIEAPLISINSQSTDTDDTLDSPPPPPLPEKNYTWTKSTSPNSHNGRGEGSEARVPLTYQNSDTHTQYPPDITHSPSSNKPASSTTSSTSVITNNASTFHVDLSNFRYTAADIVFMKKLLCVQGNLNTGYELALLQILWQVTCQICAASARGQNPHALKLIDMPLHILLGQADIPRCLAQFFRSQYTQGTTLMDVDPSAVISVIDAVRYEVLVFDLVRRNLESLVQNLNAKLNTLVFAAALEVVTVVRHNPDLSKVFTDKEFLQQVTTSLEEVKQTVGDRSEVVSSMEILEQAFKEPENQGKSSTTS